MSSAVFKWIKTIPLQCYTDFSLISQSLIVVATFINPVQLVNKKIAIA